MISSEQVIVFVSICIALLIVLVAIGSEIMIERKNKLIVDKLKTMDFSSFKLSERYVGLRMTSGESYYYIPNEIFEPQQNNDFIQIKKDIKINKHFIEECQVSSSDLVDIEGVGEFILFGDNEGNLRQAESNSLLDKKRQIELYFKENELVKVEIMIPRLLNYSEYKIKK